MSRVRIVGPESAMQRTIQKLHELKIVHIVDHQRGELDIGTPLEVAEGYSQALVTVRSLIIALGIAEHKKLSNGFRAVGVKNFRELTRMIETVRTETESVQAKLREAQDAGKALAERAALLQRISGLGISLGMFAGREKLLCIAGHVTDVHAIKLPGDVELVHKQDGAKTLIVLVGLKEEEAKLRETLAQAGFAELALDQVSDLKGTPEEEFAKIHEQLHKVREQQEQASERLRKLRKKWNDFLVLSEQFLDIEIEKANAPLHFAKTQNIFVATGWVPQKELAGAVEQLQRAGKNKLAIDTFEPAEHDAVPVKLENREPARQFEFFLRLFALPRYNEIDPSLFFSITFPLFYGFILGDMGYGLLTFGLFYFLKKKMPKAKDLLDIMMLASIGSVIFGALFGEIFGLEVIAGYHLPHILSRAHDVNQLLVLAVGVGVLHVNLGLALGFVNEFRNHGLMAAIFEKVGWMALQAAAAVIALTMAGYLPISGYVGWALLAVAIGMIYKGESMRGIIELPAIFSNILSYSRLMAVGLASVSLAVVVNDFGLGMYQSKSVVGIIGGTLILLVGHTINIGLGILGGFLHSVRLHYVEFFTKFYKGGAVPYEPFGLEKTTEE